MRLDEACNPCMDMFLIMLFTVLIIGVALKIRIKYQTLSDNFIGKQTHSMHTRK